MTMNAIYLAPLVACFVLTALLVLTARKLLVIISCLGLGSVILSIMMFLFGAPFAGAFELSVGAGLMSVLFVLATSLTERKKPR